MTGLRFIRITSARQSGRPRSSSGGTTGTVLSSSSADDDRPAQVRDVAERLRVGDARQQDLGPGQRPDRLRAVLAPPLRELAPGVGHGHDQDALARAVGEHRGQVNGTDDGELVQGLQQRRDSRPAGVRVPASPAEQCSQDANARNSGVSGESSIAAGDQVDRPVAVQEPGQVETLRRGAGVTAAHRPGIIAQDRLSSIVARMLSAVRLLLEHPAGDRQHLR